MNTTHHMQSMIRTCLKSFFNYFYKLKIHQTEPLPRSGPRLILANHTSFLDVPLLSCLLDEPCLFAVNTQIAKRWWVRWSMLWAETYIIDPSSAGQMKALIHAVQSGRPLVLFPEGGITTTGSLMKLYDGAAVIADRAQAQIILVHIDGPQYTCFSRLSSTMRHRLTHPITLTVQPSSTLKVDTNLRGRARRKALAQCLLQHMIESTYQGLSMPSDLWSALIHARSVFKKQHIACEDIRRTPLTYTQLLEQCCAIRSLIQPAPHPQVYGILLPNSTTAISLFFALQSLGITPIMLNPSLGARHILDSCKITNIEIIFTAQSLSERPPFNTLIPALRDAGQSLTMIDELAQTLNWKTTLKAAIQARRSPRFWQKHIRLDPHQPAVILMTSGSEGLPKAVALSHHNLLSNIRQTAAVLNLNYNDKLFNPMPMFHAFGLTLGTLMPLLRGIQVFTYPNPLHIRIIPELIYQTSSTLVLSTNTFLTRMAPVSKPDDWRSVHSVFCGGEAVETSTFQTYFESFGVRLLQGYGTTETSPLVCLNTPQQNRTESVGRFLPGIQYTLEPIEGLSTGQHLSVEGPNVMCKRLDPNQQTRWEENLTSYATGDVVTLDNDGYVYIIDRLGRFAKIAGERISLHEVEQTCEMCFPDAEHAILAIDGGRKGQTLVWFTNKHDTSLKQLIQFWIETQRTALTRPSEHHVIEALPRLMTGKIDYPALKHQHQLIYAQTSS
jgi:acyl-[acyl-carrier-protein]-phospholipid O-acyltransferase / long-chain-fatty-acid--[acyl-carrier-protein] ligase